MISMAPWSPENPVNVYQQFENRPLNLMIEHKTVSYSMLPEKNKAKITKW